jgi:tripartite-type tricarboxylate transporter receptor subunit TctC
MRRSLMSVAVVCVLIGSTLGGALAQDSYPSRPIRMVTVGAPRSPVDMPARLYGEYLAQALKQSVAIENRAGTQGSQALIAVKQAEPDGYTLLYAGNGPTAIVPAITPTFGRPLEELRIVGFSAAHESLLLTGATTGIRSARDFIDKARSPGSSLNHAVYGGMATSDLAIAALLQLVGGTSYALRYRAAGEAVKDLIENQLAFAADSYGSSAAEIRAGKLVALAVLGRNRHPQLPDVPTIAEAGVPELLKLNEWETWSAVFVRRETPEPIIEQLNRALRAANSDPGLLSRLRELGLDPFGEKWGPRESQAEWERRFALWKGVVDKLGVKLPGPPGR